MITGKNYIGDNLSSNSSVTFQTFNPKSNIDNDITFVYFQVDLEEFFIKILEIKQCGFWFIEEFKYLLLY